MSINPFSYRFSVNPRTGEISVAECSSSSGSNSTVVTSTNCLDYETQKSYDLLYMVCNIINYNINPQS